MKIHCIIKTSFILLCLSFGCLVAKATIYTEYEKVNDSIPPIKRTVKGRIYTTVDQMPVYPGGEAEMYKFIMDNLKMEPMNKTDWMENIRATIRFVVTKEGKIEDVEALKYKDSKLSKAMIEVIKLMPDWTPGKLNGVPANVYYTIPIHIHPKF